MDCGVLTHEFNSVSLSSSLVRDFGNTSPPIPH